MKDNIDYNKFSMDMEEIFGTDYAQAKRNEKIKKFLTAWNAMLDAALELRLEGFSENVYVSVKSDNRLADDRAKIIEGINKSFERIGLPYESNL